MSGEVVIPNIIEIEGLLFPGFGQILANVCAPWKTGFSHQVTSRGHSKMELLSWKFLSALVTSLDGKNWKKQFSMERAHWAKTRE